MEGSFYSSAGSTAKSGKDLFLSGSYHNLEDAVS